MLTDGPRVRDAISWKAGERLSELFTCFCWSSAVPPQISPSAKTQRVPRSGFEILQGRLRSEEDARLNDALLV